LEVVVVFFPSCCYLASIRLVDFVVYKRDEYNLHTTDFFEKSFVMHILQNLQIIIAMHPKPLENAHTFGKNNYVISEKGHEYKMSPNVERGEKIRKKTESITFRLESEILGSLRQEARRKDVSVNTLVSQIAKQHTNWHSVAVQAGFISVRKPLLTKLLECQNDEQIRSLARHVALSSDKDFLLMLRRNYNIHSALDMFETWISISGYSYTHHMEDLDYSNRLHSFIVQHHMGMKWSLYLEERYRNFFEDFGIRNAQFDLTDSTLAFEIVVPIEGKEDHLGGSRGMDYRR
jgi:predicted DNA-binding ribbon-helix-helix protein